MASKAKSNRGAKKRFKLTGKGKVKYKRANRNHILTKNTSKQKRQRRHNRVLNKVDTPAVKRMLAGS